MLIQTNFHKSANGVFPDEVQFRVQAMKEGFKPEPKFEPQCRKVLQNSRNLFIFGTDCLIDGNVLLFVTN